MPIQCLVYRCLLISPSDVADEREVLAEAINRWNGQIGRGLNVNIDLVRWESHSTPDLCDPPQAVINRQLVDECDLGIAVFWSRLGTPTQEHASGSVEEISRLLARACRVMVYFCTRPIPQSALKSDQFQQLQALRKNYEQQGLLATYETPQDLAARVQLHLTNVVTQLAARDRGMSTLAPMSGMMTAPTPDVRVHVNLVIMQRGTGQSSGLAIMVENHSPMTVYPSQTFLEMRNGERFTVFQDSVGQSQGRRELASGDSYQFVIAQITFLKSRRRPDEFLCAAVSDAIGRVYRSSEESLGNALRILFMPGDDEAQKS